MNDKSLENLKKGKPFKKGDDARRNLKGRPSKLVNTLKGQGYTKENVRELASIVVGMTKKEREEYFNENPDGLEAVFIRTVNKAIAKADFKIKDLIELILGDKKVNMDITSGGEKIHPTQITGIIIQDATENDTKPKTKDSL